MSERKSETTEAVDQVSITVRCGNMVVARVTGPHDSAEREAAHYAALYSAEGPVKVIRRPLRSKLRVIECTKEESERMLNALGKAIASPTRDDGSSKKEFRRG